MSQDINKQDQKQDPEMVIESAIGRSEQFIERNGKLLLIILLVVVLGVSGYFGYKHLYLAPRADKAVAAMFTAQHQFEQDSFAMALPGFVAVMDEFGGTPQANVAAHYAGLCCLYTGDYQKAVEYFGEFKAVDGAAGEVISAQNLGLTGDAYVQMKDMQNGVMMYEKAAAASANDDTTPVYLKKAGMVNESLGNNAKALEQYKQIRSNYPQSFVARDIDKFIARVEQGL